MQLAGSFLHVVIQDPVPSNIWPHHPLQPWEIFIQAAAGRRERGESTSTS